MNIPRCPTVVLNAVTWLLVVAATVLAGAVCWGVRQGRLH